MTPATRRPFLPLTGKALLDSWRSTLVWALVLVSVLALYLPLYPSMAGPEMEKLLASLPEELIRALNYDQIATGAGYAQATFFGLLGFMLSSAVAIGTGAAAIGEDEDAGLLELTLAHGVTRTQVVLERSLALLLRMAFLMMVIYVGVLALNGPSELGLDPGTLLQAVAQFLLLVLLGGTAALLGGAVGGHRTHGTAAGALVAVGGYMLNALGNQGEDLQWMHAFSPYHWALGGQPVANGVDWSAFWGLAGLNVLFVALAVLALRHRDVGGA